MGGNVKVPQERGVFTNIAMLCVGLMLLAACAPVQQGSSPDYQEESNSAEFNAWLNNFKQDARQKGIRQQTLDAAFADVRLSQKVLELDRKQPEAKWTFDDYLNRIVDKERVANGRRHYQENRAILDKIGAEYGVQPSVIVALWGMESKYGSFMGKTSTIQGLATLAYNGRRAEFFRGELIHALRILDEDHIKPAAMKGSWAGAMGQCQFMPSSFNKFAVDYDGDGHKNIWGTRADVFASIANYLSKSGWNDDLGWGREVTLTPSFNKNLLGRETKKTVSSWEKLGVVLPKEGALPPASTPASIIMPERSDRAFLVTRNYDVIMQWNRSLFFATSVGLLSDQIGNQ